MADRYWVGGNGTWSATNTTNWSATSGGAGGASAPTLSDNVFFDANSGAGSVSILSATCRDLDCTGFLGTIQGSGSTFNVYGSLVLNSTMGWTFSNVLYFKGTTTGNVINPAGRNFYEVQFTGGGGEWTLIDPENFGFTVNGKITLSNGTLRTNGVYITAQTVDLAGAGGTRALYLGSSTLEINFTNFTGSTYNITFDAGTSTVVHNGISGTFDAAGMIFNNVIIQGVSPGWTRTVYGGGTFNNLTITSLGTVGTANLLMTGSYTINSLFKRQQNGGIKDRVLIYNETNTPAVITSASVDLTDVDFHNVTASGVAAPFTGTRIGDCGLNTNITPTTPKTVYWNLAAGGAWDTVNAWALTSGGTPSPANYPLPQDTVVISDTGLNSGAAVSGSSYVTYPTIDCSGRTLPMTLGIGSNGSKIAGNLTLSSAVTLSGTSAVYTYKPNMEILTAGRPVSFPLYFVAGAKLLDDFTSSLASGQYQLRGGTFDANNKNVTVPSFLCGFSRTGLVKMGSGTWTLSGTGSVWVIDGVYVTVQCDTSTIIFTNSTTSSKTFAGGNQTYYKFIIGGTTGIATYTISGDNTFSELSSTKTSAFTLSIQSGRTQTIGTWGVNGSSGNLVTIRASSTARHNLVKSGGGRVTANYLSISGSNASPLFTWQASNSIDGGNNVGWYFGSIPTPSLGNGLFFGSNF